MLNLSGHDAHFALAENGEMLDALEVVLFQAFGRELEREHRFVVDAEGFRQTRKAELHAMARFAGDQVRKNGRPFTFGVLNSTERRVIHLALQQEEDLVDRISRRRTRPATAGQTQIENKFTKSKCDRIFGDNL